MSLSIFSVKFHWIFFFKLTLKLNWFSSLCLDWTTFVFGTNTTKFVHYSLNFSSFLYVVISLFIFALSQALSCLHTHMPLDNALFFKINMKIQKSSSGTWLKVHLHLKSGNHRIHRMQKAEINSYNKSSSEDFKTNTEIILCLKQK